MISCQTEIFLIRQVLSFYVTINIWLLIMPWLFSSCKFQNKNNFLLSNFSYPCKEKKWRTKRRKTFWFFCWVLISPGNGQKATIYDRFSPILENAMQGGAKVGLQSWLQKQSLFLYYYLLIIVLFSIQTTVNLLVPPCISQCSGSLGDSPVLNRTLDFPRWFQE